MRKAFTLIELLVIVAIIAVMLALVTYSISSGKDAARLKGGTRDILAKIRLARSIALISQQSVIIEYGNVPSDEEEGRTAAQVKIIGAKLLTRSVLPRGTLTLSGESVASAAEEDQSASSGKDSIYFQDISSEVTTGLRIKVVKEDDLDELGKSEDQKKSGISAWGTNVGYIRGKYLEKKAAEETESGESAAEEAREFVWQSNGRTDAHEVYVYLEGTDPEDGMRIKVDRYGAVKVFAPGEKD